MVKLPAIKWSQAVFLSLLLISLSSFCADDKEAVFHGESVRVLESAYKHAPHEVHYIVDSLANKESLMRYNRNYAIFNGEPGVGKSVLALAVAYKLKWDVQQFGANDFMQVENRNGTAVRFNQIMSQFEDYEANTIIIIDEINRLLMNYDSKHHDTDESSTGLWLFLDHIRHKSNLFCIGTTNGIGGFPPQLRSRFRACIVRVEAPKDFDIVKDIFFENLARENLKLSAEGLQYIHDHFYKLKNYNARDISSFVEGLKIQYVRLSPALYQKGILCIEPEHLDETFKKFADTEEGFNAKPYLETDREQREKHHQESLELAREQYQKSIEHHDRLAVNQRFLTYASLAVGTTIAVAGTAATIYFASRNQQSMMHMQKTMHAGTTAIQILLHNHAMQTQKVLQEKALSVQKDIGAKALVMQGIGVATGALGFAWQVYQYYTNGNIYHA